MSAATLGDPIYVETQVVAGINYRSFHVCGWLVRARVIAAVHFGSSFVSYILLHRRFKNGMQVTVNSTPWRQSEPITILGVSHSKKKVTKAAKLSDTADMHLTQTQRQNAVKEFKKWVQ